MTQLEFIKGMKQLSSYYLKEIKEETLREWYPFFAELPAEAFYETVRKIAVNNKFFPTINELIEKCENERTHFNCSIIDKMKEDGFFKYGVMGELEPAHQQRNYEKALMWVERGVIPEFILTEMKKYGYVENKYVTGGANANAFIENKDMKLIGG